MSTLQEKARQHVRQALMNCRSSGSLSELMVRINGFNSGMLHDDLKAIFCDPTRGSEKDEVNGFPNAIMLPKCDSIEQLSEVCI